MRYLYHALIVDAGDDGAVQSIYSTRAEADDAFIGMITSDYFAAMSLCEPRAYVALYRLELDESHPWETSAAWSVWDHLDIDKREAFYTRQT